MNLIEIIRFCQNVLKNGKMLTYMLLVIITCCLPADLPFVLHL